MILKFIQDNTEVYNEILKFMQSDIEVYTD